MVFIDKETKYKHTWSPIVWCDELNPNIIYFGGDNNGINDFPNEWQSIRGKFEHDPYNMGYIEFIDKRDCNGRWRTMFNDKQLIITSPKIKESSYNTYKVLRRRLLTVL